jgi:hypothetical protein
VLPVPGLGPAVPLCAGGVCWVTSCWGAPLCASGAWVGSVRTKLCAFGSLWKSDERVGLIVLHAFSNLHVSC